MLLPSFHSTLWTYLPVSIKPGRIFSSLSNFVRIAGTRNETLWLVPLRKERQAALFLYLFKMPAPSHQKAHIWTDDQLHIPPSYSRAQGGNTLFGSKRDLDDYREKIHYFYCLRRNLEFQKKRIIWNYKYNEFAATTFNKKQITSLPLCLLMQFCFTLPF